MTDKQLPLQEQIQSFTELEDGWDCYDGRALPQSVVDVAKSVAVGLIEFGVDETEIWPQPGADESILLTWWHKRPDETQREFEIHIRADENGIDTRIQTTCPQRVAEHKVYPYTDSEVVESGDLPHTAEAILACFKEQFLPILQQELSK